MSTAARGPTSRWRLPFTAQSATRARHLLGELLHERGVLRPARCDALLVVHELVMNGLDHGRPDAHDELLVFWSIDGGLLQIGVHDCGTEGRVEARELAPDTARGRGLALVSALSESWSVTRDDGTEVCAWVRIAS